MGKRTGYSPTLTTGGVMHERVRAEHRLHPSTSPHLGRSGGGASANHRRAVGIFDKNTDTLDMTDLSDVANIIAVAADFSGIELTNVAAGASSYTVVFVGRNNTTRNIGVLQNGDQTLS